MRRGPVTTRRIALGAVFFYTIVVGATALTNSRGRQLLQVDNAANRAAVRTARGLSQLAVVDPERVKGEGDTDALELTRWYTSNPRRSDPDPLRVPSAVMLIAQSPFSGVPVA
jgi:hypothetical protein